MEIIPVGPENCNCNDLNNLKKKTFYACNDFEKDGSRAEIITELSLERASPVIFEIFYWNLKLSDWLNWFQ